MPRAKKMQARRTYYMPDHMVEALAAFVDAQGIPESFFVRRWVDKGLRQGGWYDVAKEKRESDT